MVMSRDDWQLGNARKRFIEPLPVAENELLQVQPKDVVKYIVLIQQRVDDNVGNNGFNWLEAGAVLVDIGQLQIGTDTKT